MHPFEAGWTAQHLEQRIGASGEGTRVTCYPVPTRPGFTRRRARWAFAVATDLAEVDLRELLGGYLVEFVRNQQAGALYVAWPREAQHQGCDRTV